MPQRIAVGLAWTGILLVALFLRLHDLGERPMHFDEATGARFVAQQMDENGYRFNPGHFHGPMLSMMAARLSEFRGQSSWHELEAFTLRLTCAIGGTLLILVPLLWTRQLGAAGPIAAGALLATSPILVYYSRMFIHETLLALFSVLSLTTLIQWTRKPSLLMALLSGSLIGLMWATKETFVITLFSWLVAALLLNVRLLQRMGINGSLQQFKTLLPHMLVGGAGLVAVTVYLYTDGFRDIGGLWDPVGTFLVYEAVPGHAKGFLYYTRLLLWPHWQAGVLWWEGTVLLMGICGLIPLLWYSPMTKPLRLCLFLLLTTLLQVLIYSLIPYKTPWLMVGPWVHACLFAGASFGLLFEKAIHLRFILISVLLGIVGFQTYQSTEAIGRFSSDTRNPYAYVPTLKDAEATSAWLVDLRDSIAPKGLGRIGILGSQYWPLPWYLRPFGEIGYWLQTDSALQELSVVIAMPDQFEAADTLLSGSHVALPRGLREDTPMILFIRQDIWNQWMEVSP